jgi:hypothetical protein
MELEVLPWKITVCKTASIRDADLSGGFFFLAQTDEEVSLVCRTENAPEKTLNREDGWRGFRVRGELDFSLTGILAGLANILAENGIPIFAVSTYNTDYVLTREENFEKALEALRDAGYEISGR